MMPGFRCISMPFVLLTCRKIKNIPGTFVNKAPGIVILFGLDNGKVLSAIYSISTYFANTTFMHIPHILPCFWAFCVRFRSANLTTINAIGGKNSGKMHDGETDNQIRKDNHKELPITLEAKRTLHML